MIYVVRFTYRAEQGALIENHVLVMAEDADAAAAAFWDTHTGVTIKGQHKIKSVEKFSTVELDTLI